MKVYNISDVPTPLLAQRHMKSQTFAIHGKSIAPGGSADYDKKDAPIVARAVQHLVKAGALAVDKLPDEYIKAKAPAAAAPAAPVAAPAAPAVPAPPATPAARVETTADVHRKAPDPTKAGTAPTKKG